MKIMLWKRQEVLDEPQPSTYEVEDATTNLNTLKILGKIILFLTPVLFRIFKNNENSGLTSIKNHQKYERNDDEYEEEISFWNKSEEKKKARWNTVFLILRSILPYLVLDVLEEAQWFIKILDVFKKLLSSFTGDKAVEEAESIVILMKDSEFLSLDTVAFLAIFVCQVILFPITKEFEDVKFGVPAYYFAIQVPFLVFTMELLKAAANDKKDFGFVQMVQDESKYTGDLLESLIFLSFILVWAFVDVHDFIADKKCDKHYSMLMLLLLGGFLLEVFNVSFNNMGIGFQIIPNHLKWIIEYSWSMFAIFYFSFNRVLFWPAYLLRFVFHRQGYLLRYFIHPLFDNVKRIEDLDSYMLRATPAVWLISAYFGLPFCWFPWCPFTIIVEMNKEKEKLIQEQKKLKWYRNWRSNIFNVVEENKGKKKIYLVGLRGKNWDQICNHQTNDEWGRLMMDFKKKMKDEDKAWASKILEMRVSFEEFTLHFDCLKANKEGKKPKSLNLLIIIASCPHVLLEEVKNIVKANAHCVKLLEYDCD